MVVRCLMFFLPFIYLFFLSPLYLLALIYLPTSCLNEFFLIPPTSSWCPWAYCIIPCPYPVISLSCSTWEIKTEANRWQIESHSFHTQRRRGAFFFFFILVHPTQTHSVPQCRSPFALVDNHGFNCSWLRTNNPILKIASLSKSSNNRQIFF